MGNPVFNRLEKQWGSPPGGLQTQNQPYGQNVPPPPGSQAPPIYDQAAFQRARQAYEQPSANAVEMGRLTYDDVIVKTAVSLTLLVAVAAVSWFISAVNPGLGLILMMVGLFGGLVVAMVNIFSKKVRPALILTYAALEGMMLGALSLMSELVAPGVVLQAVVATFFVFGVTLALFASGKVRNSPKLQKMVFLSLIGIIGSRLLIWLLGMFGVNIGSGTDQLIFGIPLPVIISVFAVFVAVGALIGDFDQVKVGVENGVSAKYAWMSAFGIMVTLIWLYVEILNILVRLNQRN